MKLHTPVLLVALASTCGISTRATAQVDPAELLAPPEPVQALAPAAPQISGPSIVQFGTDGLLKRVPEGSELAALAKLTLSPEEKSRVDAIIAARNARLDPIIRRNISLVLRVHEVRETGLTKDSVAAMRELGEFTREFRSRDQYRADLGKALAPANAQLLGQMISEYRGAFIAQGRRLARERGSQDALAYHMNMESFTTACEDVRYMLDRQLGEAPNELIARAKEFIAPAPGQVAAIDAAIQAYAKITSPTPQDKIAHVRGLLPMIREEQRRALLQGVLPAPADAAPANTNAQQPAQPSSEAPAPLPPK